MEAYSRLFRFDKYEDIDAKDFAEKTGMNVKSVASMIKQAAARARWRRWRRCWRRWRRCWRRWRT